MVKHELMRIIVHPLQKIPAFVDDGLALSPCQNSRKKCGYFDILLLIKLMRYTNGIIEDEFLTVILRRFYLQKVL